MSGARFHEDLQAWKVEPGSNCEGGGWVDDLSVCEKDGNYRVFCKYCIEGLPHITGSRVKQ